MQQTDQEKGFAHIGIVIAVMAVVAAIGFGGWYVWQRTRQEEPKQQNGTSNNHQAQEPSDPSVGGKYLVITEWGVRFLPPEGLRGDIYMSTIEKGVVESPSIAYDPATPMPSEKISFGSKKLDALAGKEGYSLDTLVFIERTSEQYPAKATPFKLKDFKTFNGKWFTLRDYKAGEIDIPGYDDHLSKIYSPLIEAIQKMEQI